MIRPVTNVERRYLDVCEEAQRLNCTLELSPDLLNLAKDASEFFGVTVRQVAIYASAVARLEGKDVLTKEHVTEAIQHAVGWD